MNPPNGVAQGVVDILVVGVGMLLIAQARKVRRANVAVFVVMLATVEAEMWLNGLGTDFDARLIEVFLFALLGLVAFHRHKIVVIALGAAVMSAIFVGEHGGRGLFDHFLGADRHAHERRNILLQLLLLLPGFDRMAYFFEHSGACAWIERRLKGDRGVLFMLWALSGVLDNIATAMLGGAIIKNRYGSIIRHCRAQEDSRKRKLPGWLFLLLVAVVGVSNLGGAASAFGDTTTTMMWIHGVPILALATGYPASFVGQLLLARFSVAKHKEMPEDYDHTQEGRQESIDWTWRGACRGGLGGLALVALPWRWGRLGTVLVDGRRLLPMLGIPGMALGNVLLDQPGLGLWAGMLGGYAAGRALDRLRGTPATPFGWGSMLKSLPNTAFLLVLIYAAKLIPLAVIAEVIFGAFGRLAVPVDYDVVAVVLGLISPVFDNIPLASLALDIGGFEWPFLALAIGFGGSMLWFGSSAGVALAKEFPELEQTRDWFPRPFFVVFGVYWVILLAHLLIWQWLPALFAGS